MRFTCFTVSLPSSALLTRSKVTWNQNQMDCSSEQPEGEVGWRLKCSFRKKKKPGKSVQSSLHHFQWPLIIRGHLPTIVFKVW